MLLITTRSERLGVIVRSDRERVESRHVALETRFLAGGEIEIVDTQLTRLGEERVVDVGHVADAADLVTHVDQTSHQHVVRDERGRVADVRGVVRGDSAGVHENPRPRFERHDRLFGGVVQAHRHDAGAPATVD